MMPFEGEFASYKPIRGLVDSPTIQAMQNRMRIRHRLEDSVDFESLLTARSSLPDGRAKPDLILAIDGSNITIKAKNGYPGAEMGYITVASVLLDLNLIDKIEKQDFTDPREFRETEKASSIEAVFPGWNVVIDDEEDPRASFRRCLFELLKQPTKDFQDCGTLLDTYEELFRIKQEKFRDATLPKSPIEDIDKTMSYGYGEYKCPHSSLPLFSTDALRLHELMNPGGSNGELFGQVMATLEKLWLVHLLRAFEKKGWLSSLRRIAFIMDGPLAVFSTSSWLARVISYELTRINNVQKEINKQDMMIFGIEKSGTFVNHFNELDTQIKGGRGKFPEKTAMLLDDFYIKQNIIFSPSRVEYGKDTYFGRKFFYKTARGQLLVAVTASFNEEQKNLYYRNPEQFSRLADIMDLLDRLVSNRYPNSISPLVAAHSEAAIPLNLGKKIFEEIAREINERHNCD